MSDFGKELPTNEKLKKDIKSGKLLISLLTLGGRATLFKGIDKNMYNQISDFEKQASLLMKSCEEFNKNFSENGWIAYELMKADIIIEANKIFKEKGLAEAEKTLINYYSNDIEGYLPFLKRNVEFAIRYDLIKAAFEDHKNKKYYNSIPIFLMMVDGAVSDFANTGFAAEKTNVEAWDSIAGHSQGLNKLKEIYTKNRTKTTTDPIYLPYRNGILHGRDLDFGNEYVSCKALGMIFAVNDWITAKKTESSRKNKFIESAKTKTWSELIDGISKNAQVKQLIEQWKPRDIVIGKDIPSTGLPNKFENGTPEQAVAIFFELWKKKNYGLMAKSLDSRFFYEKSEKKRAGLCRELFGSKNIEGFEISSIEDRAAAITVIILIVKWSTDQKNYVKKLTFGVIYCDEDDKPLIRGQSGGRWIINGWDIGALYL